MSDRASKVNLENTLEEVIDPATEEKQDVIIDNQTNWTQKTVRYDSNWKEVVQLTTAFWEQSISEAHPQWQQSFEYTVGNTALNTNTTTNWWTVTQSEAMAVISTSTTTWSNATLNSAHHAKYKAGFGWVMRFSYLFTTPVAWTHQYVWLMDEAWTVAEFVNGYALWFNWEDAVVTRFQNDTQFNVTQANWDDSLDGNWPSWVNMDFTKLNVFYIQFQYLWAWPIYFWTEDPDTWVPFRFHTIKYANVNITPSTFNPNFHFTMHVDNAGTTANLINKCASYWYFIEWKTELIEIHQPQFSSWTISKAWVTIEAAIFTIRNKATYPTAAPKNNYIDIILERFWASLEASSTNNLGTVRLVKNATIWWTPSYTDISATNSIVDIDTAWTTVTWGVELISFQLAGKNDKANENLLNLKFIIHPWETVTLSWLSVNSATIMWSLLWKELF